FSSPSLSITTASSCRRALRSGVKDLPSPCSLPPLPSSMGNKQSRPSPPPPVLLNGYHATRSTSRLLSSNDNCKEPLQVQCNGMEHCNEGAKSDSALVGSTQGALSLRSMRSVSASYPGSTKDLSCRSRSQRSNWGLLSTAENQSINNCNEPKAKQISKRNETKVKRLSGEEKLLEDNKSYYKVEVLHSKLRSAGSVTNDSDTESHDRTKDNKSSVDDKEPIVVRLHKVRRTELNLLSNEAENFMFGEPKRPLSETSSEDENDSPHENGDCKDNVKREISKSFNRRKKYSKRRTHAEAFIHDNLDYYKFEISDSRLRINSSHADGCKDEIKKEYDNDGFDSKQHFNQNCKNIKDEKKDCDRIPTIQDDDFRKITFSFEVDRDSELWLKPFIRQHNLEEDSYPPDIYSYDSKVLPFEKPKNKVSKVKFANSSPIQKVLPSRNGLKCRGKKSVLIHDDGRPRKSPRCHASTLAILSTVTNRRRPRDSPEKPKEEGDVPHFLTDDENTRSSLIESLDLVHDNENLEETLRNFKEEVEKLCISNNVNDRYHEVITLLAKYYEPPVSNSNNNGSINCQSSLKSLSKPLKRHKSRSLEDISSIVRLPICMDVDPSILTQEDEIPIDFSLRPGPISDVSQLVTSSAYCCSMDRVSLEQSHKTVDLLRNFGNFDGSCNSSDCGASSTCETLGFMEDGRTVSRKRKRKRPNMTGWPLRNQKRKTLRQEFCYMDKSTKEEHSVVVESSFNDKEPLIFNVNNCESLSEKSILDMEKKKRYFNPSQVQSVDSEDSSEISLNRLSLKSKSCLLARRLRSSNTNSSPEKQSVYKKHPKKRKKWGSKLR
ncbi:unnamed protein product, partial [Bemisia tabaci]